MLASCKKIITCVFPVQGTTARTMTPVLCVNEFTDLGLECSPQRSRPKSHNEGGLRSLQTKFYQTFVSSSCNSYTKPRLQHSSARGQGTLDFLVRVQRRSHSTQGCTQWFCHVWGTGIQWSAFGFVRGLDDPSVSPPVMNQRHCAPSGLFSLSVALEGAHGPVHRILASLCEQESISRDMYLQVGA